ncbi:MAG: tetratricopeptide repeat protein [Planctomycetes bacterium]|nr:tetratricopeptide repeat protein [Planctomycetota bacterium]MBI3844467.1 tetratricopeptide repeat protein [Planctomycetota bacterium]
MRRIGTILFFSFVFGATAMADVFHLKDGRTIEGSLVRQTDTQYIVKTIGGEQTLDKANVTSVDHKKTPKDEFDEKFKAVKATDADGFYQLGLWCEQNKLKAEAAKSFKKALEIEPQHEGAHKALGHVQYNGAWMSPADRDALVKKNEADEQKAAGKVLFKGQWVTPEEKANVEKGLVKVGDEWMTPEEKAKIDKGFVKVNGRWLSKEEKEALDKGLYNVDGKFVSKEEANTIRSDWEKAWEIKTEHYLIKTNKDVDYANKVAELAENEYKALKEFFGGLEPKLKEPMKVFVFKDLDEYKQFSGANARGEEGYHSSQKGCFLAITHAELPAVSYYFHDDAYNYTWTDSWLYHVLAHQYQNELLPGITSPWLTEGIGMYFELFKFFKNNNMKKYRKMLTGERFIKLEDLMKVEALSDNEQHGFMIGDDVGNDKPQGIEAGLLFLFLTSGGPTADKEALGKFFQKMVKGSNDTATFEKFLPVKKLDKEFQAWLETLGNEGEAKPKGDDKSKN